MDFEDAKAAIRRIYEQMPENQRAGLKREDWWYTYKFKQKAITSLLCILMIMRKQPDISFISLQRLPLLLRSGILDHDALQPCSLRKFSQWCF